MDAKLKKLIAAIEIMIQKKLTGSMEIHFSQGGISKVIKHEEVK